MIYTPELAIYRQVFRCAVSAVLKYKLNCVAKGSQTILKTPLRAVAHATKGTSGLIFITRGLHVTPSSDISCCDFRSVLLPIHTANMDSQSTNERIQTYNQSENLSSPDYSNNTIFTSENEPKNSLTTDSQRLAESSADDATLEHLPRDEDEECTKPKSQQELPTLPESDKAADTSLQNEATVSNFSDMKADLESEINETTPQIHSSGDESPQASSPSSSESVFNEHKQILPVEKDHQFSTDPDKDYPPKKTPESGHKEEKTSPEMLLSTNLPTLTDVESSAIFVTGSNASLVSHIDSDQIDTFLSNNNNMLSFTNENFAQSSQSIYTDHGNHPQTSKSIKNMFPRVTLDQETSRTVTLDPGASTDSSNKEDQTDGNRVKGDVILVTGGCGFLGQHIIKMLQLRAPHVAEIRVLDLSAFEKRLDYQATKRITSLVGDISNKVFVENALRGVNSVIHVAGVVSWGTFPDLDGMEKVNVKGTLNVVKACLKNNVQRLVYCSTVDVAVGSKPIRDGTEENTPVPDKFLFPGYPDTKYHGERIVQGVGQYKRDDGGNLQTVILRPNVLYGELDKYYVTNALRLAHQSMGIMYKIGNGKAMFQQAYVGNAAWAFVCADAAMKTNPKLTDQVFYIPDNTPIQNSFNFLEPYLTAHKLKLSNGYLSYALSHSAVAVAEMLARAVSPVVKLNLPVQSCTIAYINTDLYFNGRKAKELLNYEPIYTANEAREMSMKYYANIDLEGRPQQK